MATTIERSAVWVFFFFLTVPSLAEVHGARKLPAIDSDLQRYVGHTDPDGAPQYNIWGPNCHTASNVGCLMGPGARDRRGVFACLGDASVVEGHTGNWEVNNGQTCLYSWGVPCCWSGDTLPPSLDSVKAKECVERLCGKKFVGQAKALPAGQLAEIPGPGACVEQITRRPGQGQQTSRKTDIKDLPECFRCCWQRATTWSGKKWGSDKQASFFSQCRNTCNAVIADNAPNFLLAESLPQTTGRWCSDLVAVRQGSIEIGNLCKECCAAERNRGSYADEPAEEGRCTEKCKVLSVGRRLGRSCRKGLENLTLKSYAAQCRTCCFDETDILVKAHSECVKHCTDDTP